MHCGHGLQFGIFLTPLNNAPKAVVALARRSEELGYDYFCVLARSVFYDFLALRPGGSLFIIGRGVTAVQAVAERIGPSAVRQALRGYG